MEVDAKYIKGMLNEPDLQPNATINRWIQGILLFDFTLVHVPAHKHQGPDALSRQARASDEEVEEQDDSWLDEIVLLIHLGPLQKKIEDMQITYPASSLPSVHLVKESRLDKTLHLIRQFLGKLEAPSFKTVQESQRFVQKAMKFFMKNGKMYKKNDQGIPLKVIFKLETRQAILLEAHEGYGHRGEQPVWETIQQRFYWPHL